MPKPVVRWLVGGLIPAKDLTIIGGRPKVGKTRVAVAIVAAVLRGEPFLEFSAPTSSPPVLLVTDDQSAGDIVLVRGNNQPQEVYRRSQTKHPKSS